MIAVYNRTNRPLIISEQGRILGAGEYGVANPDDPYAAAELDMRRLGHIPDEALVDTGRDDVERARVALYAARESGSSERLPADVVTGSVGDVLRWVDDDMDRARAALAAEEDGEARKGVLRPLRAMLGEQPRRSTDDEALSSTSDDDNSEA